MQSRQAANNWTPSKASAKINQGLYAFGKSYEIFYTGVEQERENIKREDV